MEKMIVANHKMNMSLDEIKAYIDGLSKASFEPVICPSSVYISYFIEQGYKVGIQNIYTEDNGPYTGEVSASQAKSLGADYVMVGHSERRRIFNESDEEINLKIKKAIENDLKVIFCVGDNIGEDYKEVISRQIRNGLNGVEAEVIVSYEPIYAIGTNIIPSKEELTEIVKYIKSLFSYDVKVLYGGSVNLENALELKDVKGISGYLIGSGSLDINEFINIGSLSNSGGK